MKKIIFRKLLLDWIIFFSIALLSSSLIVWVIQAVNYLDILIDGYDYLIYIYYSLLSFPKIFTKLLPFVLFFSLFYVIVKYEQNNELVIFWYFGIKKIKLINLFFRFSLLFFLIQIFLTSFIVPYSLNKGRSLLKNSDIDYFENFIKSKKFNDTLKGLTLFIEHKDPNGDLYNLYLKRGNSSENKNSNLQVTYAKKGIFKKIDSMPILVLFDGETISVKDNEITNLSFAKSDFILKNYDSRTTTYTKTQETLTIDILKCINKIYGLNFSKRKYENPNKDNCSNENKANLLLELYKRLIIPFYIPILSIVPFILIIYSKENSNYSRMKVFTFLIGLSIIIFSETTIRFISESLIKNFQILLIPIILLIIFYMLFFYSFKTGFKNKI